MAGSIISSVAAGTLKRLMVGHPYFGDWNDEQIKALEPFANLVQADAAEELLTPGDLSPYDYFLFEGQLRLQAGGAVGAAESAVQDKVSRVLSAGDFDAGFPIAHLRPSQYRVTSVKACKLLRIETSQLKSQNRKLRQRPRQVRFRQDDTVLGGSWKSHDLVTRLMNELRDGSLKIPSIPAVALRIRRSMASPDFSIQSIATIVAADPSMAGRLIQVANSSVFAGVSPCETVQAALVRLGVEKTRNLVFTLATRNLFKAREKFIHERMLKSWQHAIDIAALCAVLAKLSPGLDSDRALLVGLLHEIGSIPILKVAENYPDLAGSTGVLDETLAGLGPEISSEVLKCWNFHTDFSNAALDQSDWYRDHEGPADYSDLVVVAHLHALVRQRQFHRLPRLDETPAFQKLALGLLSPQLSLLVLDEAKGQIQELKTLLS